MTDFRDSGTFDNSHLTVDDHSVKVDDLSRRSNRLGDEVGVATSRS